MQFNFLLPNTTQIKFCIIKQKSFFILNNNQYCVIPQNIQFFFENHKIIFISQNLKSKIKFLKFLNLFLQVCKKTHKYFLKKLLLKGLGLKASLSNDNKFLELKLGFSHLVKILIPAQKIKIKIIKNTLIIQSSNLVTLCNFLYKIKKLKLPNIYKGKGIWYKYENILLKPIKKL